MVASKEFTPTSQTIEKLIETDKTIVAMNKKQLMARFGFGSYKTLNYHIEPFRETIRNIRGRIFNKTQVAIIDFYLGK